MTFTLDTGLHLAEIVAAVVIFGMMKADVNWLKEEVHHLRRLCEYNFGIRKDR
jgi:uncharacterized tellurite resistance protein B-like protein